MGHKKESTLIVPGKKKLGSFFVDSSRFLCPTTFSPFSFLIVSENGRRKARRERERGEETNWKIGKPSSPACTTRLFPWRDTVTPSFIHSSFIRVYCQVS